MLRRTLNFITKYLDKNMENKVVFVTEAEIDSDDPKEILKKVRAVRRAVKNGVNSIDGVKATRIYNKDK